MLLAPKVPIGLITEITVRILPRSEVTQTVLAIFGSWKTLQRPSPKSSPAGMVPAALEIMDRLVLQAVEAAFRAGYPPEAGAVLSWSSTARGNGRRTESASRGALSAHGASELARPIRWRLAPSYGRDGRAPRRPWGELHRTTTLHDAVVARSRLPELLHTVVEIGRLTTSRLATCFTRETAICTR